MSFLTLRELSEHEVSSAMRKITRLFRPTETVSKLIGYLNKTNVYEVPVVDGIKVGIVSLRDLLGVVQPQRTKVAGYPRYIEMLTGQRRIADAVDIMCSQDVRAVIVSDSGEAKGILSQVEIVHAMTGVEELREIACRKVMSHPVKVAHKDTTISSLRSMMIANRISHVPVVDRNKLLGMATAQNIVRSFIIPITAAERGERAGEGIGRLDGPATAVVDTHPFVVDPEASCLEVAKGFRELGKSACLVMGLGQELLGIITPRELMSLLRKIRQPEDIPVTILGLSDQDGFFESSLAEEKLRRVLRRNAPFYGQPSEAVIRIEKKNLGGKRTRYELTASVRSPKPIHAESAGWDLLAVFDDLCDELDRQMRSSKTLSRRRPTARRIGPP